MQKFFTPSWISCLGKSMSKWLNQYTCPGCMLIPCKPWPCGNEYHTICCGKTETLVEGKDEPTWHGEKEFNHHGKTSGCMLCLAKPLFHSSKVIMMGSMFCILQGIVELQKMGVFTSALIKKRCCCPKHIQGDTTAEHFKDKEVGAVDAWPGTLDGVKFNIFAMKELDYIMSIISTYGTCNRTAKENKCEYRKDGTTCHATFLYPEVITNHFTLPRLY